MNAAPPVRRAGGLALAGSGWLAGLAWLGLAWLALVWLGLGWLLRFGLIWFDFVGILASA